MRKKKTEIVTSYPILKVFKLIARDPVTLQPVGITYHRNCEDLEDAIELFKYENKGLMISCECVMSVDLDRPFPYEREVKE